MGRMRIKKKDVVIPFRETLAYRTLLVAGSLAAFIVAFYFMVTNLSTNTIAAITFGAIGAAAAFSAFYHLDQMRNARVPKRTLDRMKRR